MGCGFSRRVDPNNSSVDPAVAGVLSSSTGSDGAAARRNSLVNEQRGIENNNADSSSSLTPRTGVQKSSDNQKDSSLSFVIPIGVKGQDSKEGSIIRKHPPIRLRRLEEEQQILRTKLTLDDLEKRQAEAEERRRKILDSRVQSAQHFQRKVHQQQNREEESEAEKQEEKVSPISTDWSQEKNSKNPPLPRALQDFKKSEDENIIDSLVNNNKPRAINHDQLS